jgi:Mg-chelatase subunit ChlI
MKQSYNNERATSSFDLDGYEPMSVVYQLRGTILRRLKNGEKVLPEIDGRSETKADVLRALLSGAHPYLVSEEGTGKTRLARSLTGLLPDIPAISGCPYHDDPKWPRELLCPRCRESKDPVKEFGIELLSKEKRFSRIQGNEYTNEAKLLGLKDIQAIAQGESPSDPKVFTGTGVFRANRGILFVDEMPSIRTKVQVLFHPILEEKKAILEEYSWEHPLDLILVATGNPRGFSHVNEIPRPLLDRLELIYMELPDEEVEKEIILSETFGAGQGTKANVISEPVYPTMDEVKRKVAAPWWVLDIVNKSVRYSRTCPNVENKASIRATSRSLEHTYASCELDGNVAANLRHAYFGLRLALRGRLEIRADLIDYEDTERAAALVNELVSDFMWNTFEDIKENNSLPGEINWQTLGKEVESLLASEMRMPAGRLPQEIVEKYPETKKAINLLKKMSSDQVNFDRVNSTEKKLYETENSQIKGELNYSALEFLSNIAIHRGNLNEARTGALFIASKFRS